MSDKSNLYMLVDSLIRVTAGKTTLLTSEYIYELSIIYGLNEEQKFYLWFLIRRYTGETNAEISNTDLNFETFNKVSMHLYHLIYEGKRM
jgi:hypothetical protein